MQRKLKQYYIISIDFFVIVLLLAGRSVMGRHRVFLAVGSNLGDRFRNIQTALQELCRPGDSRLLRTSYLHETAPMYVTDQPPFLNGAVEIETDLPPLKLLDRIKAIEEKLGRDKNGIRNGPRPVDLDILMYEGDSSPLLVENPRLSIPHPRIQEREFVLAPLCEVAGRQSVHPTLNRTFGSLLDEIQSTQSQNGGVPSAVRVIPLKRNRVIRFDRTILMGILNVTPDSFSDGGAWNDSVEQAAQHAFEMEQHGADIIDIGGESTRPGAADVLIEEELERTIPVIERIRKDSDVPISIDTRRALVAETAVNAGADIVNDVSGGTFDSEMLPTVARLGVPMIVMHMRGTPQTMQKLTKYDEVVEDVSNMLRQRLLECETAGIHRWLLAADPGIGFAKDLDGNLSLLRHLSRIRAKVDGAPLVLGTSRKGFIGKLTGVEDPKDRDYGTISSCVASVCLQQTDSSAFQPTILRVHNVQAAKQAATVMDAILKAQ